MGNCAYCKQNNKLSKEHVIPKWFIKAKGTSVDISYLERAPKKLIKTELTISDVCASCNSGPLSVLDEYGRFLYNQYFHDYVYDKESIEFKYNYQNIVKWLLKCSYNSARAHNTDLEILDDYSSILLNEEKMPPDILVYCTLISPIYKDQNENILTGKRNEDQDWCYPNGFRLGVFRIPNFYSIDWCFRTITINSYGFFLFIPKLRSNAGKEKRALLSSIKSIPFLGNQISKDGITNLGPPQVNTLTSYISQIHNNPLTYNLTEDSYSKDKDQQPNVLIYTILRSDIESSDIDGIEKFFINISSSREMALRYMQNVEFVIDGYNDDPRELHEISEVVRYLSSLNKIFPYWLFYQLPYGSWLNVLLMCLAKKTIEKSYDVVLDKHLLVRHMENWFISLNEFCHKYAISTEINRKITSEFTNRVNSFFEEKS